MKPTERFSDRVDNYVKFRPGYPPELSKFLREELGVRPGITVADIGSGTGISTEIFLREGAEVYAIEPNDEMRAAAERMLQGQPGFKSVKGASEATGLPDRSIDVVVAAQAFHWFQPSPTALEFNRILKPGGRRVIIWNERLVSGSPFSVGYEAIVNEFGIDYNQVNHKHVDEGRIREVIGTYGVRRFANDQVLDFESLLGRAASSSYLPNVGHPRFEGMRSALRKLFDLHQVGGRVRMDYETVVYYSRPRPEFIKHFSEIQEGPESSYYRGTQEFLSIGSPFSRAFGLKRIGIHHEVLPPGRRTSWPHAESAEEEFVFVIEGYPDAWIDGELYRLGPGDAVGFPSGTGISHSFLNNTEKDARLIVVGEASKIENLIYYPLHPSRREQCKDTWWHEVPRKSIGPHDGLPDKLRARGEALGPLNFTGVAREDVLSAKAIEQLKPYSISSDRYCVDEPALRAMMPELERGLKPGAELIFKSDLGGAEIKISR